MSAWTQEWPTAPGFYWMHTEREAPRYPSARTSLMEVWEPNRLAGGHLVYTYVSDGAFIYPSDFKHRTKSPHFQPAVVPEPPKETT